MKAVFKKETDGIYRLCVPFEKIYTSVFLITAKGKNILVDCATTADDVDDVIVPALKEAGYGFTDIDMIVISHDHGDHSGGLDRILELAPDIKVVREVTDISDGLSTYSLSGHTLNCIGVFDGCTNTLISCDGLQGAGVDKYRCSIKDKYAYIKTLEKIKNDEKIENILFSHAYEPWNKDSITGRNKVLECLSDCMKYI